MYDAVSSFQHFIKTEPTVKIARFGSINKFYI